MTTTNPRLAKSPLDELDALRAAAGLVGDDVPAGALTVKDWAERFGIPLQTADNEVARLVARGLLCVGKKRIQCGYRSGLVNHYWKAPNAKA